MHTTHVHANKHAQMDATRFNHTTTQQHAKHTQTCEASQITQEYAQPCTLHAKHAQATAAETFDFPCLSNAMLLQLTRRPSPPLRLRSQACAPAIAAASAAVNSSQPAISHGCTSSSGRRSSRSNRRSDNIIIFSVMWVKDTQRLH